MLIGEERLPKRIRENYARISARYRKLMTEREKRDQEETETGIRERIKDNIDRGATALYEFPNLSEAERFLENHYKDPFEHRQISVHEKNGKVLLCIPDNPTSCELMMLGYRSICRANALLKYEEIEETED